MSQVSTERVLVVPTAVFHRLGHFQGFERDVERYLGELLAAENISYRPRGEVEEDPSFKQLIPYVIFRYLAADGTGHVFQYTRGGGMGEGRLHRKRSIGIGGHISLEDEAGGQEADPYEEGLRRELDEEVEIRTPYQRRCVGLINDDETEVGRVHLGVVYVFDVERPDIEAREVDIIDAGFRPVSELLAARVEFETWSQICLEALFA